MAFWDPFGAYFGRLWRLKQCQKMKSVSGVFWGSKFDKKSLIFGSKFRPRTDDRLLLFLKSAKSIFEQQSMLFSKILGLSNIHRSLVLEAKIGLNRNLETDLNLGPILERFGHHILPENGVQIDSKPNLEANLFLELFLTTLEGAGVEVVNPKMTI